VITNRIDAENQIIRQIKRLLDEAGERAVGARV
jgi:hypothetical protein